MDAELIKKLLTRLFTDMGDELHEAARNAHEAGAKEAIHAVAHNVRNCVDMNFLFDLALHSPDDL